MGDMETEIAPSDEAGASGPAGRAAGGSASGDPRVGIRAEGVEGRCGMKPLNAPMVGATGRTRRAGAILMATSPRSGQRPPQRSWDAFDIYLRCINYTKCRYLTMMYGILHWKQP